MAKNMKLIPSGSLTAFLTDFLTYEYVEKQNYFTADGRVYRDLGNKRVAITKIEIVYQEKDLDYSNYLDKLVVIYNTIDSVWGLWYVNKLGVKQALGGGGGTTYTAGDNLNVADFALDKISVSAILKNMTSVLFFDEDFTISQGASAIDTVGTPMIKINKADTVGASKIEIGLSPDADPYNAPITIIGKLDFGG